MRSEYTLSLSEEEAHGLLSIILLAPTELTPEQISAAEKLAHCCRSVPGLPAHRLARRVPVSTTGRQGVLR